MTKSMFGRLSSMLALAVSYWSVMMMLDLGTAPTTTEAFVIPSKQSPRWNHPLHNSEESSAAPNGEATTATATATATSTAPSPASASASVGGASSSGLGSKQKEYGKSLELPSTYIRCGRCSACFAITAEDLGTQGKGCRVECGVCSHSWYQTRDRLFEVDEGYEFGPFPEWILTRTRINGEAGRPPDYRGHRKFYVGNLDFSSTDDDLADLFGEAGHIGDINIVTDDNGRSRGFAFITMLTDEGGDKAAEMNGIDFKGRKLIVNVANN